MYGDCSAFTADSTYIYATRLVAGRVWSRSKVRKRPEVLGIAGGTASVSKRVQGGSAYNWPMGGTYLTVGIARWMVSAE